MAKKKLSGRLFGQDFHENIWWGVLKIKGQKKTQLPIKICYLFFQEGSPHAEKPSGTGTLLTTSLEQARRFPTSPLPLQSIWHELEKRRRLKNPPKKRFPQCRGARSSTGQPLAAAFLFCRSWPFAALPWVQVPSTGNASYTEPPATHRSV